jgi:Na+-translocating ferredoxin:NAD+ oxidoreductase RnfG subunit
MRKSVILFVLLHLLLVGNSYAFESSKYIQKKIDKTLSKCFGKNNYSINEIDFIEYHSKDIKDIYLNEVLINKQKIGYLAFASSFAKDNYFDYMVVFDKNFIIKRVVVLEYRSSYGSEIMAKHWLRQFEGKHAGKNMIFNKDIDAISGATLSAPALSEGVKFLSELLYHKEIME